MTNTSNVQFFSLSTDTTTTTTTHTMSQGVALLVARQLTDLARKASKK
jgi:hypothetical protein